MLDCVPVNNRRRIVGAVSYAAAAMAIVAVECERVKKRRRVKATFHRCALHSPLCSIHTTAWRQLLSCGTSSDFLIAVNLDRHVFFDIVLPVFITARTAYRYGSPYRRGPKTTGRPCSIITEDILELVLWGLKSSARRINLCPIFGLVPTSDMEWFRYGLKVLYRTLKKNPRCEN